MKMPVIGWRELPGCPRDIDMVLLDPHEAQALKNHSQSLAKLASRGGMSPSEIYAVAHDARWAPVPDDVAVAFLSTLSRENAFFVGSRERETDPKK